MDEKVLKYALRPNKYGANMHLTFIIKLILSICLLVVYKIIKNI